MCVRRVFRCYTCREPRGYRLACFFLFSFFILIFIFSCLLFLLCDENWEREGEKPVGHRYTLCGIWSTGSLECWLWSHTHTHTICKWSAECINVLSVFFSAGRKRRIRRRSWNVYSVTLLSTRRPAPVGLFVSLNVIHILLVCCSPCRPSLQLPTGTLMDASCWFF